MARSSFWPYSSGRSNATASSIAAPSPGRNIVRGLCAGLSHAGRTRESGASGMIVIRRDLPVPSAARRAGAAFFSAGVLFLAAVALPVAVLAGLFAAGAVEATLVIEGAGVFFVCEGAAAARAFRAGFFGAAAVAAGFFGIFVAVADGFCFAAGEDFFRETVFSVAAAGFLAAAFADDAPAVRFAFGAFSGPASGEAFFLAGAVSFFAGTRVFSFVPDEAADWAEAAFRTGFFAAVNAFFSGVDAAVFLRAELRFCGVFELFPAETDRADTVFFFVSSDRAKDVTSLVIILPDYGRRARKIF